MSQCTSLIISALQDYRDVFPDMTFGEILYSMLRKQNLPEKPEDAKTGWLLEISDEALYNAVEKSLKTMSRELSEQ